MKPARQWLFAIAVALPLVIAGCFSGAVNPSRFPYWFGQASVNPTHAKPGGLGYFANTDPHAVRLEVRPLRSSNPVRTQHLIVATVLDEEGDARRKRRVEWLLEGVGSIVEVDESGYLGGRGYKVDNKYAVSFTDFFENSITRGNDDPADDFVIRPGQSWCIVSSPIEGETRLTVYAPEIFDWDKRTQVVTMQWVDCQWQFPTPTAARAGTPHTITTHLYRHTDRAPLPNYRVRYTLRDGGPQAELLPNRSREVTVNSDQSGNASVAIQQLNLAPGANRVAVEIFRNPDPNNPNAVPILLASEETTIDWQSPQIKVNLEAPTSVAINQEIPATITVTNAGQVETQTGMVYLQVPPGMSHVRSDPPARVDSRGYLVWDLNQLGGGREQKLNVTFRAREKGAFPARVTAMTRDSLKAEQGATFQVDQGVLKVEIVGPPNNVIGVPGDFEIRVSNPSAAKVSKVVLDLWLGPELVAITPNGARFERKLQNDQIPPLKAGESRTLPIKFDALKAGRLQVTAMVSAEGGISAEKAVSIDFTSPQVELIRRGPDRVYIGREGIWSLVVRNSGSVPITNAMLRDRVPAELSVRNVSDGGAFDARTNEAAWNFGTLAAGEERLVRITAVGSRPTTQGIMSAMLSGSPNVEQKRDKPIQVLGVPALRVDVSSDVNPVQVGGRVTYTIRVTNQGTLPADQVDVAAEVPALMRAMGGQGMQRGNVRGNLVTFPAVNNLLPNQTATFSVWAQATEGGDARFRATVRSASLGQPVVTEEATRILPNLGPTPGRP